jgi:hypothetical protein
MVRNTREKPTDSAWEAVLKLPEFENELSKSGYIEISANRLKKVTGLEPRILAKMDFSTQRPAIFQELALNILPIENGKYRLGHFNVFRKVAELDTSPIFVNSPFDFESVSKTTSSEGIALRKAEISTMIDQFCGEQVVHTFSGRERSPKFNFSVNNYDNSVSEVIVDRVQIEIDGGFEGKEYVYVFEVKNVETPDFNIRQLYFPFRAYTAKCKKKVRCIYLTHSNDVFTFHEYEFKNPLDMSSIKRVKSQSYVIKNPVIELDNAITGSADSSWSPIDGIPFPQADSIQFMIDILKFSSKKPRTSEELVAHFDLSARQLQAGSSYYSNAAKYLDLGESFREGDEIRFRSTHEVFTKKFQTDQEIKALIVERLLKVPGVPEVVELWTKEGVIADTNSVMTILDSTTSFRNLGESTKRRRAQTIRAWSIWVIQHTK